MVSEGVKLRSTTLVATLLLLAALALPAASAQADARVKLITGTLSKRGHTVIALAASGRARTARATNGKFALRPPASVVTLHVQAPNGKYAGPVVLATAKRGQVAIVGVRAGARLGKINLRRGYATVAKRPPKRMIYAKRVARARRGVPIGAGVFGRVRSRPPRGAPLGDLDLDGVPDALDIDDDGDLVLDDFDPSSGVSSAQTLESTAQAGAPQFAIQTFLWSDLWQTVNANAATVTTEQIDAKLRRDLQLQIPWRTAAPGSAELDCGGTPDPNNAGGWIGGLPYCTQGGTGTWFRPSGAEPDFPECCDPDGDGFGTLQEAFFTFDPRVMLLRAGATSSQIGSGDLLIERVTTGGVETQSVATLGYVFATNVAMASYDDGQGRAADVSYPVGCGSSGVVCDTGGPYIPVAAGQGGDVKVALRFWRPQRRWLPGDPGSGPWTDIGRLVYYARVDVPGVGEGVACPPDAYTTSDPNLEHTVRDRWPLNNGGFVDRATDRPASPANTLTFTLNLSRCLQANGASFGVGQIRRFGFFGVTDQPADNDTTAQDVRFMRGS